MILGIYGSSGSGREAFEMVEAFPQLRECWEEIVFIDDTKPVGRFWEHDRIPFSVFSSRYVPDEAKIVIAMGEPANRDLVAQRVRAAGYALATLIHPTSTVSPYAEIGLGVVIKSYCIVSSDAKIRDNVWIQSHVIVGHDVTVSENCQISAHASIAGHTHIGRNVYIGLNACIREQLTIGDNSVISMGAAVMKDVRPNKIVMGNPAREMAENSAQRVFR